MRKKGIEDSIFIDLLRRCSLEPSLSTVLTDQTEVSLEFFYSFRDLYCLFNIDYIVSKFEKTFPKSMNVNYITQKRGFFGDFRVPYSVENKSMCIYVTIVGYPVKALKVYWIKRV